LDRSSSTERIVISATWPFAGKLVRDYGDESRLGHTVGDCPCPVACALIVRGDNNNRRPVRAFRTHDKGEDSLWSERRGDPFDVAGSGSENMPGSGRGR